eukprot:Pgem_evm1s15751
MSFVNGFWKPRDYYFYYQGDESVVSPGTPPTPKVLAEETTHIDRCRLCQTQPWKKMEYMQNTCAHLPSHHNKNKNNKGHYLIHSLEEVRTSSDEETDTSDELSD